MLNWLASRLVDAHDCRLRKAYDKSVADITASFKASADSILEQCDAQVKETIDGAESKLVALTIERDEARDLAVQLTNRVREQNQVIQNLTISGLEAASERDIYLELAESYAADLDAEVRAPIHVAVFKARG